MGRAHIEKDWFYLRKQIVVQYSTSTCTNQRDFMDFFDNGVKRPLNNEKRGRFRWMNISTRFYGYFGTAMDRAKAKLKEVL